MRDLVYIGMGGFLGAVLRYLLSGAAQLIIRSFQFPFGTLAVNLIGSFIITFLAFMTESLGVFGPSFRSFILIGVIGSFTTFSTFSYETLALLHDGEISLAAANVAATVVLCLLAAWLGRASVLWIWR